jgi:hypothetical protein
MPDFTAAQQNQAATITGAGMPSTEATAVVNAIKALAQDNPVVTGTATFANIQITTQATMPDGATWGTSGITSGTAYVTTSTPILAFGTATWSFASVSNSIAPFDFSPTIVQTGTSAGNVNAFRSVVTLSGGTGVFSALRSFAANITVNPGFTGTLATAEVFRSDFSIVPSSASVVSVTHFKVGNTSNGTLATTGTLTNVGLGVPATFAGVAGTNAIANNYSAFLSVSTAGANGTSVNRALYITGNGGTGANTTNHAIYSDSQAPSYVAGTATFGTSVSLPGGATALTFANSLTNGTGTQIATIVNGPVAGNPTKWFAILDGTSTRYMPAW